MNSNLDVWASRTHKELECALSNIKTDNDIIIYSNLLCGLNIGEINITSRGYDTFLYSEENDLFIMLLRGGEVTVSDMKEYLDNKKLNYNEVTFADIYDEYKDDDKIPELWFAREICVLKEAFTDSISKNNTNTCEFYPYLTANLELNYLNNNDEPCKVDGRFFKGIIKLEDKIVLLVNQNDERNVRTSDVFEIINKYNYNCIVLDNPKFSLKMK